MIDSNSPWLGSVFRAALHPRNVVQAWRGLTSTISGIQGKMGEVERRLDRLEISKGVPALDTTSDIQNEYDLLSDQIDLSIGALPASAGTSGINLSSPIPEDQGGSALAASFPSEFDFSFYRASSEDFRHFSNADLWNHYQRHGRGEGRIASPAATREGLVRLLQPVKPALEIGPFYRPVLKPANAKFFDVLSTDDLRKRAKTIGVDADGVPSIDYVSSTGDLSIVNEPFSLVFSSHAIEHQPDLISHLQQVERILEPGGCYGLIIPDARYCFDHFLTNSNIGEVIDAHLSARKVHTLKNVIEHRALTTHNDALRHWQRDHGKTGQYDVTLLRSAITEWREAAGGYIDVHAWQFTPPAFRGVMKMLHELGFTRLKPWRVYDTPYGHQEFCAVLLNS